jgi:hypothetical protein
MTEQQPSSEDQPIERGAAEEASGVPLTPTEDQARRRAPSQPDAGAGSDQPRTR